MTVTVGFVYNGVVGTGPYESVPNFGHYGNGTYITAIPTRQQVTLPRITQLAPPAFDETPVGLGGWNVNVHHAYDPSGNLYLGDGTTRAGTQIPNVITKYTGGTVQAATGGTIPSAYFCSVGPTAVASDGTLYVVNVGCWKIYRISPAGVLTLVAGTGTEGYNGDGVPATQAGNQSVRPRSHRAGPRVRWRLLFHRDSEPSRQIRGRQRHHSYGRRDWGGRPLDRRVRNARNSCHTVRSRRSRRRRCRAGWEPLHRHYATVR